ncbi:MAG: hypothetical protein ACREDS_13705 [Limisphaerales bacterium]
MKLTDLRRTGKPDNEMRISFGSASEENIREGIKRLGNVLKKFV